MNRSILSALVVGVTLLLGLIIVTNALTGQGNTVGQFAKYALVACFFIGILAPRISLYLMIVMTGYLDLIKRVMILDLRVGMMDLYYVLGMAPLMLAGITVGLLIKNIQHGSDRGGHWKIFAGCCGLFTVMAIVHVIGGFSMRTLGNMANNGAYVFLIYALWNLVRDSKDVRRLLLFLVVTYIPVALYTFWQSFNGLSGFELAYLETGLSIESRQFGEKIFRPFSTMNAAGNLSVMMAILAATSVYLGLGYMRGVRPLIRIMLFSLVPMFAYAAFLTYSRGGWVCGAVALVGVFMFGSKVRLVVFYASGLSVVAIVAMFADTMVKEDTMMNWSQSLKGQSTSDEESMATKLQTFNSRLHSINLTMSESRRWRPFGLVVEGDGWKMAQSNATYDGPYFVHDGFSLLLMKIGYIPLSILMTAGTIFLYMIHKTVLKMNREARHQVLLTLGMLAGITAGFTANHAQLITFPINFYFYFFMGLCLPMVQSYAPDGATMVQPARSERPPAGFGGRMRPTGAAPMESPRT